MYWRRGQNATDAIGQIAVPPELRQPQGSAGTHSCGTRLGGRHRAEGSGVQGRSRPSQTAVDGTVQRYRAQRYYMLNKPMGVITASRDERHDTVLELFPAELRRGLFAVGRLDKDTEGLLLITDDGALSHALMSPNRHVEKEYEAVVDGALAADAVSRFEQGMTLPGRHGMQVGEAGNPRDRAGAARACDAQRGQIPSGQAHDRGSRRYGNGAQTPAAGWSLAG